MKKTIIASLLTALLAGNVLAASINVPFTHKAVPAEGLNISYNTYGSEKVVCTAENFYKGYVYITKNGALQDAGVVYGNYDDQEFYFTSIGQDKEFGDINQFHVDKSGYIKLQDTNYKPHDSYASCFYVPESAK